jgi:putative thiol:disulfide interchange protein dsbC
MPFNNPTKKTLSIALAVALGLTTACTPNSNVQEIKTENFKPQPADKATQDRIKESLDKQIKNGSIVIDEINTTPSPDLYELIVTVNDGQNMVYSTKDGRFVIAGSLLDSINDKNLSAERLLQIQAKNHSFDILPTDTAIKTVFGKGTHKIAVFTDPDCPYCKRLEADLAQNADKLDLTVYTLILPIEQLHEGALHHSRQILCSKDQKQAWHDWILKDKAPESDGNCETAKVILEKVAEAAMKYQVQGTPTIVFENGFSQAGAESVLQIQETAKKISKQMELEKSGN